MAQLIVRKLEPEIVAKLRERAGKHGRSAEEEHRAILREALLGPEQKGLDATFERYLRTMPDVGDDSDFSRIDGAIREIDLSD
jgi:antitoxin FitA